MTERIIIAIIFCLTFGFLAFTWMCAQLSLKKKQLEIEDKNKSLDGDHDFIDREEFEEYEQMVKERFEALESCMKTTVINVPDTHYSKEYKDSLLNAMKNGDWDQMKNIVEKHQEK